jgi:hypothetical protein
VQLCGIALLVLVLWPQPPALPLRLPTFLEVT